MYLPVFREPQLYRQKKLDLQYPITTRMTANATNPIRALMGIVRIHAHMMLRATPHFTVLAPHGGPDTHDGCTDDMGRTHRDTRDRCPEDRCSTGSLGCKPVDRAELGDLVSHGLDNPPSPGKRPECNRSIGDQDHPERDGQVVRDLRWPRNTRWRRGAG